MTIRKTIALVSAASVAAYLGYKYVTADPPGYCRAQQRHITDEEFIRTAVAITERDMNTETDGYPEGKTQKRKNYSNGWYKNWDFDSKNPNCCLVLREDTQRIFYRMFDLQDVEVWLNPKTTTYPVKRGDYQLRFFFNVCGTLIDSDIGLPDTTYPIITTTN